MTDTIPPPVIDGRTVHVHASTYTVTCLPDDELDGGSWALTVEYRGRGLWAVKRGARCLSSTGE